MKGTSKYIIHFMRLLGVLIMSASISGCFESSSSEEMSDSGIYFPIDGVDYSAISLDASASGLSAGARLLASQCAQCHGTFGVAVASWPDLYGPGSVGTAMTDYQDLSYIDNLMHVHALAYTSDEVNLLKTYYSKINYNPVGG